MLPTISWPPLRKYAGSTLGCDIVYEPASGFATDMCVVTLSLVISYFICVHYCVLNPRTVYYLMRKQYLIYIRVSPRTPNQHRNPITGASSSSCSAPLGFNIYSLIKWVTYNKCVLYIGRTIICFKCNYYREPWWRYIKALWIPWLSRELSFLHILKPSSEGKKKRESLWIPWISIPEKVVIASSKPVLLFLINCIFSLILNTQFTCCSSQWLTFQV